MDRKKNFNKNKKPPATTPSDTASSGDASTTRKLTLINSIKAAMITNFQCTSEQAEKLWSEAVQDSVN